MNFLEIYWTDVYKTGHKFMLPEGSVLMQSNFTPRSGKYSNALNGNHIVSFGQQMMVRKIKEDWDKNFFQRSVNEIDQFGEDMTNMLALSTPYDTVHFKELHKLGYLPIEIRAIEEGNLIPYKVPLFTIVNTKPLSGDVFDWIVNYLETILSAESWQAPTSATLAFSLKELGLAYAKLTDEENVWFVDYQFHDFSMRGMGGKSAIVNSGLGFATSSMGSDTLPVIPAARKYYDEQKVCISSVIASEHAIMCTLTGFFLKTKDGSWDNVGELEVETFRYLLNRFPSGILSLVSDTWDLWRVITEYCVILKDEILARDGKLVIRPDCLDDQSQILTPDGWKFFKDLSENDLVAQVKRDKSYEFVKPLQIINEPYEGDMYEIRDFHGKIDLLVTPNHRLVSYCKNDNSISINEASNYKQNRWGFEKLRSPNSQTFGKELSWHERLLIALQADGTIRHASESLGIRLEFNFQKQRKHDRLLNILQNLGYEYNVYYAKSRQGQSTITVLVPNGQIVSKIFDWVNITNLDSLWSWQFIEELKHWDSSIRNEGRFKYDTTIKKNIDIVEYIAIAAGKGVYISKSNDKRKEHFSDVYTAHIVDNPYVGGQSISVTKVHYKGTVHCVKVPTGMILVKRNQGICVTGNSGDPVDIVCGKKDGVIRFDEDSDWENFSNFIYEEYGNNICGKLVEMNNITYKLGDFKDKIQDYGWENGLANIIDDIPKLVRDGLLTEVDKPSINNHEKKGVVELLWDVFGGRINKQGYKCLDSHIGVIYGDSINYSRADNIFTRLMSKGFASTNIVLGVGSYSLQYVTRDTHGFAQKATYVEIVFDGVVTGIEIFKDPVTDDGVKKSAKGLLMVKKNNEGEYVLKDQCTWDDVDSSENELKVIFKDGEFFNQTTLTDVRGKLQQYHERTVGR